MLLTGNNIDFLTSVIAQLYLAFSLMDLSSLHYFLGIQASMRPHGLLLSQMKYITGILEFMGMATFKPISTLMVSVISLFKYSSSSLSPDEAFKFHKCCGSLQYITFTRPDLIFTVNKLT